MKFALTIIHIVVTVFLIGLILMQNSKGGLGSAFGGGEGFRTRRGAERIVFIATIFVSILFLITSIINVFVR